MSDSSKKSKSIFEMIKLGCTLVIYAVISCTVLAVVNNFTSPKIVQNQINKANTAMKTVFPDANNFEPANDFATKVIGTVTLSNLYVAKNDDSVIGGIIQVAGPTYDKAKIMVGLRIDGTVSGIQFLEISDSPGFGLKSNDSTYKLSNGKTFYEQFTGKEASEGFTVGKTFDAISGATITSVGVGTLVTEGTNILSTYFTEHNYE